tara:strand:+ start:211 stop:768 length:558 start_codon:yes stop_codon:yes gene_type:complete
MTAVVNSRKFKSEQGFESPKFSVDTNGKLVGEILDIKQILLNGVPFVGTIDDGEEEGGGGGETTNPFENIADLSVNTTFNVTQSSVSNLRVANGIVTVASTNTGSIDNMDIGQTTPGQAKFYELDIVPAGDSTAAVLNADGATVNGSLTFNSVPAVAVAPTINNHVTTKGYVDSQAIALSIALGV